MSTVAWKKPEAELPEPVRAFVGTLERLGFLVVLASVEGTESFVHWSKWEVSRGDGSLVHWGEVVGARGSKSFSDIIHEAGEGR